MRGGRGMGWLLVMGVTCALSSPAWALDLDKLEDEIQSHEQESAAIMEALGGPQKTSADSNLDPNADSTDSSGLKVQLIKARAKPIRSS